MNPGLLLHLSGIMQSWGGPQGGTIRDTYPHPTRSAITGLLAAAQGRPRGSDLTDLDQLTHTTRIDRPGRRLVDFHTVGGGAHKTRTVRTADGDPRGNALVFDKWYLADAAFTLALTGPPRLITTLAQALTRPVYPPHLGRRSCPPNIPVLIATSTNAERDLHDIPLHREPGREDTVTITYLHEHPPAGHPHQAPTHTPVDTPRGHRHYGPRNLWETRHTVPSDRCAGLGTTYLKALTTHRDRLLEHTP
ncbi:type I-E CRISPR-associated protein Cas5/CasD [Streptomyces sp. NPDC001941]|uniref:type I-E CRISPR-associated protein Cas5/CasD n=1 Tax=Streptomyces sp. NPDC001941 TaxID=3154659 RepID=UPI00331DE689